MKFHDFSPFYRSNEGIKPKVSGDRLLDNPLVADVQSGASYKFDGTNDVVTVGDDNNIDFGNGDYSFGCWFKTSTTSTSYLVSKYLDSTGKGVNLYIYSNAIRWWSGDGTDSYALQGNTVVNDGNWHHVVAVMDRDNADNVKIYLNGIAESATATGTLSDLGSVDNAGDLSIGARHDGSRLDGEIRQVRLHNRALTAAEVRAAYNGQSVGYEYTGASQTSLVTGTDSDFTGSSNWVNGNNVSAVMNHDSGDAGHSSTMQVDATGTAWSYAQLTKSNFTVGKKYRISFDYKIVSGSSQQVVIASNTNTNNRPLSESLSGSGWQSHESTFISNDSAQRIWVYANYSGSGSTSDEILVDNFTIVPIGCVAEYLPESISSSSWLDSSGNELDGSVSGATAVNAESGIVARDSHLVKSKSVADLQSGASFKFDGSDDVVSVSVGTALANLFNGGGSVTGWIKPLSDGEGDNGTLVTTMPNSGTAEGWTIHKTGESGGKIKIRFFRFWASGTANRWETGVVVPVNQWTHISISFDSSSTSNEPSFYLNGSLSPMTQYASGASGVLSDDSSNTMSIGNHSGTDYTFDGEIRELRFHNRALSADEVRAAYNGQAVPFEYAGSSQSELITNAVDRDFSGSGNWGDSGNHTATIDSGELKVVATGAGGAGASGQANLTSGYFGTRVKGKTYRLTFTARASVAASLTVRPSVESSPTTQQVTLSTSNQTFNLDYVASVGVVENMFFSLDVAGTFYLDNVSLTQIGCVAEYLPTGISATKWINSSGTSGLDGTVTSATAINHEVGSLTMVDNIVMASGKGIDFSATSDATGKTSEVLNDYEEGTWTPAITLDSGSATVSASNGQYTKIGNQVTVSFSITVSGVSAGLINTVTGLPFTAANVTAQPTGSVRERGNQGDVWHAQVVTNTATFLIRRYDNSGALADSDHFVGSVTYIV